MEIEIDRDNQKFVMAIIDKEKYKRLSSFIKKIVK